jgi:hypothetical protein
MTKMVKNKQKNPAITCNVKEAPAEAERRVEEESLSESQAPVSTTDNAWIFLGIKKEEAVAELQMIKDEQWEHVLPISCRLLQGMVDFFSRNNMPDGILKTPEEAGKPQETNVPHGPESITDKTNPDTTSYSSAPPEKEGHSKSDEDNGNFSSDEAVSQADTKSEPDLESPTSFSSTCGSSCTSSLTSSSVPRPGQSESETSAEPPQVKASLKIRIPVEQFPGVSTNVPCIIPSSPPGLHCTPSFSRNIFLSDEWCAFFFSSSPQYNFIGRLLGPRGVTLKNLQSKSGCRLYIRGRGSLRFKDSQQEMLKAMMPGYEHLREDLHVLIEYEGSCEARISCLQCAEKMVNELLQPPVSDDQDELKKTQLKELAILNGTYQVLLQVTNAYPIQLAEGCMTTEPIFFFPGLIFMFRSLVS